jgi:hypothetical protein
MIHEYHPEYLNITIMIHAGAGDIPLHSPKKHRPFCIAIGTSILPFVPGCQAQCLISVSMVGQMPGGRPSKAGSIPPCCHESQLITSYRILLPVFLIVKRLVVDGFTPRISASLRGPSFITFPKYGVQHTFQTIYLPPMILHRHSWFNRVIFGSHTTLRVHAPSILDMSGLQMISLACLLTEHV